MKQRLLIIGAGGFGRQLEHYLDNSTTQNGQWELAGYIDDDQDALKDKDSAYAILGSIDTYDFRKDDLVLIAIADIEAKRRIVELLTGKVEFFSFIASDALIGKYVSIGEGAIICPGVKIGSHATIGRHNIINLNAIIGHDSVIGDNCSIMPHVDVGGGAKIGNGVFIGTKGTVSPRLQIADNSYLGVGSVVIKNITDQGTYFGNPARRMLK